MSVFRPETIGGVYFLRLRDYLPLVLWVYLFSAGVRGESPTETVFWVWFAVDTIALGAMALWFALGHFVFFRSRHLKPAPFSLVVAFGVVLGGLKGLVTGLVAVSWGLEDDVVASVGERVIQTSLAGAWAVPLVSIVAAGLSQLSNERATLIRLRAADQLRKPWELGTVLAERTAPLVERLIGEQQRNPGGVSPEKVRQLVDQHVRPLSRDVWSKAGKGVPPYRPWQLYAVYLSRPFTIPWVALAIWSVTTWPALFPGYGVSGANVAVFTISLGTIVTFSLARLVPFAGSVSGAIVRLVALVGAFALATAMSVGIAGSETALFDPLASAMSALWFGLLLINVGAIGILRESRQQVREQLDKVGQGEDPLLSEQAGSLVLQAKVARLLHNDVQNRLLALASRAESRHEKVNTKELLHVVREAWKSGGVGLEWGPLEYRLDDIRQRWSGVIDLEIESSEPTGWLAGSGLDDVVVDIITEGLTNAVRHGLASEVRVLVSTTKSASDAPVVTISLRDNGVGPRLGVPGLGTHLLDTVCPGGWSLTAGEEGGAMLAATIDPSRGV